MFHSPLLRITPAFRNLCFYFYLIKKCINFLYKKKHNIYTLKHKFAIFFVPSPGILSELKLTQSHQKNIILTKKVLVDFIITEEYTRLIRIYFQWYNNILKAFVLFILKHEPF